MIPAIEVHDLTVAYREKPALWDVDLAVPTGSLMAIVGPNGAGKTTLLKSILGLIPAVAGNVFIHGEPFHSGRRRVAYVPQKSSVDWDFPTTVFDLVRMGTYGRLGWFRRPGAAERDATATALRRVGLGDLGDRQIGQLSGGQQQRAFLARALVQDADVYALDEPLQGVDAVTERAVMEILRDLRNAGKTIIAVHHDLHTVPAYFDSVTLLNVKVIASGKVGEAFTPENLKLAYGDAAR
ncbi:MAG: metal ABC transporter ATP-binding protein [Gemmataceae bacterium]|nr:metal ABC transporter ATP-binding protein [Gemmataceae bacterium]